MLVGADGSTASASSVLLRQKILKKCREDIFNFLNHENGQVAIFDAVNPLSAGRRSLAKEFAKHDVQYIGYQPEDAVKDYLARIAAKIPHFETMDEPELNYIKMYNAGERVTVNNCNFGYLSHRIVFYLLNLHIKSRQTYFARAGSSREEDYKADASLSPEGHEYAKKMTETLIRHRIEERQALIDRGGSDAPLRPLSIWTSTRRRTIETAAYLASSGYKVRQRPQLSQLNPGVCEKMSERAIRAKYPDEIAKHEADPYHHRYPRAESYHDLAVRLEPIILELEREENDLLIVAHESVLRVLYAYLMACNAADIPLLAFPRNQIIEVESEFIAVGGNRHPAAADWDPNCLLLAFGADNDVALWDPLDDTHPGVRALLSGHTDKVTAVKFLRTESSAQPIILSGSVDKTIRVWRPDPDSPTAWLSAAVIVGHEGSINAIAVLPGSNGIFATGAADATVKIWQISLTDEGMSNVLLQTIEITPRFFPLALDLGRLDCEGSWILAIAGTKSIVQIYVANCNESGVRTFHLAANLSGHEGWIRSLAFVYEEEDDPTSDLLLASASQDKYIRLWRVHQGPELPAANNAGNDPALGALGKSLSNKAHRFESGGKRYSVTFEALLLGHDDWIYTASWRPWKGGLQLLSASADNSLAIWEPDSSSGVWVCIARLGEISAQKGSTTATGSTGGFWQGLWSPSGMSVVSLGRTGSWRLWTLDEAQDRWIQGIAISGHVKPVNGIAWDVNGDYLLSTSSDQTTRLFAEWQRGQKRSWYEFARPQIHGYDLNCIDSLGGSSFISGADEKLLRVFEEPKAVANLLSKLCGIDAGAENEAMPDAANVPVLGLSNKAIQAVEDGLLVSNEDQDARERVDPASVVHKSTLDLAHPPFEDHLARHTLWPESEKLYGHGYEISTVAASHDRSLVATACKASSVDHAVIRLYDTQEWREIKPALMAHYLTVTSLKFSSDDRYLLSVGRDRQWAVFERAETVEEGYKLVTSNPKGHSRMILDASWAPAEAGRIFATAGRDKSVKIWEQVNEKEFVCKTTISATHPANAVDFLPRFYGAAGKLYLAFGTEAGGITICGLDRATLAAVNVCELDWRIVPSKSISQLSWRPYRPGSKGVNETTTDDGAEAEEDYHLAIGSEDSSLRVYSVSDLAF
ncbi:MAG: hypothetical protein M1819_007394 [Sarea resinae]|nr:MAG: hypothetical protein M1819_007394 [Sarea resinae]